MGKKNVLLVAPEQPPMPTLSTLVSQQETFDVSATSDDSMVEKEADLVRRDHKLKHTDTELSVFTELETPDVDTSDGQEYQARFTEIVGMEIPLQPQLHHKDGQSHVGTSLFDGSVSLKASDLSENVGDGVLLNVNENKWNGMVQELREMRIKCTALEDENKYVIESKMHLLDRTSTEINKLRQIVNAILQMNIKHHNFNMNELIKQML